MANYTLCAEFIKYAGKNYDYYLNVLILFAQSNAYKVCVDDKNIILEIYKKIASKNKEVSDWLSYMSYNLNNYEKIAVNLESFCAPQELFIYVCKSTVGEKSLIVETKQNYSNYENDIELHKINMLDKDEAKQILSYKNNIYIYADKSNVAVQNSNIDTKNIEEAKND